MEGARASWIRPYHVHVFLRKHFKAVEPAMGELSEAVMT